MLLKKEQKPAKQPEASSRVDSFSQARLDKLWNSMQPLMTKHASDEELEQLFKETDAYLNLEKGAILKPLGGLGFLMNRFFHLARVGGGR
jgi:hypothetical protein